MVQSWYGVVRCTVEQYVWVRYKNGSTMYVMAVTNEEITSCDQKREGFAPAGLGWKPDSTVAGDIKVYRALTISSLMVRTTV
ncbi:MAG: hypothetical protein JW795_12665 [Chitinivibrionales bacterium]|nr:hypothetical protein [Chitinivibrionales bacterium]